MNMLDAFAYAKINIIHTHYIFRSVISDFLQWSVFPLYCIFSSQKITYLKVLYFSIFFSDKINFFSGF